MTTVGKNESQILLAATFSSNYLFAGLTMTTALNLAIQSPGFTLEKAESGTEFLLTLTEGNAVVSLTLTAMSLRALVFQADALLPSLKSALTSPEIEASFRQSGERLANLDDRAWQTLLHEVPSDTLTKALWYLKNPKIGQAVFRNISERVAVILMADLNERYRGHNPDHVPESFAILGREALANILDILAGLQQKGQITCC